MSLNSQELSYLARLVKEHQTDLNNRETGQVNQSKYGSVDSPEYAGNLWFKLADMIRDAEQIPEGNFYMNNLVSTDDKGQPRIEHWGIVDGCVSGYFYSRENMPDGVQATTTDIKSITNDTLITRSGSVYKLGKKEDNPKSWIYK